MTGVRKTEHRPGVRKNEHCPVCEKSDTGEAHAAGYQAALDDTYQWMLDLLDEWRALKIYTHEELWAAQELLHEMDKRTRLD